MIKLDYVKFLNDELIAKIKEDENAKRSIKLYENIIPAGDDIRMAKFRALSAEQKLDTLKNLMELALIFRIESSSNAEVEEFRANTRKSLLKNITEHEREINKTERFRKTTDEDRKEHIATYVGWDEETKKNNRTYFEEKGTEILEMIEKFDETLAFHKTGLDIDRHILEQINKGYRADIISDILKSTLRKPEQVKNKFDFRSNITDEVKLLASVEGDYDKTLQMLKLLDEYRRLTTEKKQVHEEIDMTQFEHFDHIEHLFYNMTGDKKAKKVKGVNKIEVYDADALLRRLAKYKVNFNKALDVFNSQFTREKLEPLETKWRIWDTAYCDDFELAMDSDYDFQFSMEKDIKFLGDMHADKIKKEKLESLDEDLKRYKILNKKLIKTESIRTEMHYLYSSIGKTYYECLGDLFKWYSDINCDVVTPITYESFRIFYSSIVNGIKNGRYILRTTESVKAQNYLESELEDIKGRLKAKKESLNLSIKTVENKIRELVGPEFADTDLTPLAQAKGVSEEIMTNAFARMYEEKLAKEIYDRAMESAEEEEMRITLKTEDELREERRAIFKVMKDKETQDIARAKSIGQRRLVRTPKISKENIRFRNNPASYEYETEMTSKFQETLDKLRRIRRKPKTRKIILER